MLNSVCKLFTQFVPQIRTQYVCIVLESFFVQLEMAYFSSHKNISWYNPLRRWIYHKALLAACTIVPISVACSYMLASYADPPASRASNFTQTVMYYLPLRIISRLMGILASSTALPQWVHHKMIQKMADFYSIDMKQCAMEDFSDYKTLQEFFTREIKQSARPIDENAIVVSPCDGTVQRIIDIDHEDLYGDSIIEHIKGDTFRLSHFLQFVPGRIESGDKRRAIILHLGPGDYHRFHSPKDLHINRTVHVPGKLYPVKATALKWLPRIFISNERVILRAEKCAIGLVGASMVGSIKLPWEERVSTNMAYTDKGTNVFNYRSGHKVQKGEQLGKFEFGSCIVLIVDVPMDMKCSIYEGQQIKVGQAVFSA